MSRRYALRDDQWERIKDLLPGRVGHVGVTAQDNRLFVEAVLYRYRAGIPAAGEALLADKAYDSQQRVLDVLESKSCQAVIPAKANRKKPRKYDLHLYQARHPIENFFARLKQYRAIATRYDQTARNFLGAIYLAATVIWLN